MNDARKKYLKVLAALILLVVVIYDSSCPIHWREGRSHPFLWVLYGVKVFNPNRALVVGRWFDTWSLGKEFLLFARSAFVVIPGLLIIRRLLFQNGRIVRLAFSAASVLALSYPAAYLFLFGHDVCRYIQRMGFTFGRVKGLFAAGFYGMALIAFAVWLLLFSCRKMEINERQKMLLINFCTALSIVFCVNLFCMPLRLWRYEYWGLIWKACQLACFPALLLVPFALRFSCTSGEPPRIKWFRMMANGLGLFAILFCIS